MMTVRPSDRLIWWAFWLAAIVGVSFALDVWSC